MSTVLARQEMHRFLSSGDPEVLSISGRWGVGKTFGWHRALEEARAAKSVLMTRYAYVSAFGVKSLDELKTAIFQSTVNLDSRSIEPTIKSFQENLSTVSGLKNLAERGARKSLGAAKFAANLLPYGGEKAAELLVPGASLLIKNQMICIDDIERTGQGLDVIDILGLVSMLREEKGCKIMLLLNEEGLGEEKAVFRKYLEKVVDQAIHYIPTPSESAATVLDFSNDIDAALAQKIERLGITNIRVIKRIQRFLGFLTPELKGLHASITDQAITTTALFGWCVFEPTLAPDLGYVAGLNAYTQLINKEKPSDQEVQWNALLKAYGFQFSDDFDRAILTGLQTGGFDVSEIKREAEKLDNEFVRADIREGIRKPWHAFGDNFDDNEAEFRASLVESVKKYAAHMGPQEFDSVFSTLKELGAKEEADRLLPAYMAAQAARSREFFNLTEHRLRSPIDPEISSAFAERLAKMPLERDPKGILLEIERKHGWSPDDEDFLASLSEDDYYTMLKATRGEELAIVLRAGLQFGSFQDPKSNYVEIARKLKAALERLGEESRLNAMRIRPYIGREKPTSPPNETGEEVR